MHNRRNFTQSCMGLIALHATYDPSCSCQGKYIFLTIFHIIYLDYQLLETIGTISRSDAQKASSRKGNYQDATTTPLSHTHDDEAARQEDGDQFEGDITLLPDLSGSIFLAIDKVSYFNFSFSMSMRHSKYLSCSYARLSRLFVQAHSISKHGSASSKHQHIVQMAWNANTL